MRFARRQFELVASEPILHEYAETAWEVKIGENLALNPQPWLNWIANRATLFLAAPLDQPVSADADDDKFIECALAARARYIVSRDRHLLRLEKPFGIAIVDDRRFKTVLDQVLTRKC